MKHSLDSSWIRVTIVVGILLILMAAHWTTATDTLFLHAVHTFFRKLFFIPVILAALWFSLRGALLTCAAITFLYLPFIFTVWQGNYDKNFDQLAEIVTVWIGGILFGILMQHEKKQQKKLVEIHEGAVIALVNALDAREHDTQLHSLRVQAYALHLGRKFAMNEEELLSLGQGALLHDIGKIGIPDRILLKNGPLTDGEWERMREHPAIGKSILEHANFFHSATDIVFSHHEKYDGSGYPRGLKGDQISLGARVFSIVDAFDALTSSRPYQDEVDFHEALNRLEKSSGKHFDPEIMNKFTSVKEKEWKAVADGIETNQSIRRNPN